MGWMILHLKYLRGGQYSFQKVTQFSQQNNVLFTTPSNIEGFLLRDICVSSIHLKRPILKIVKVSPTWESCEIGTVPFRN
jgi:hypothetical protein